ncbi:MAG: MoaD/ThiS family protein [Bacteroidia bacterium]|nr:MoaD/ThiS family protein [Bacteroidia bacterium]
MRVNVLVFGQIAEITGSVSLEMKDTKDTNELVQRLITDYPKLKSIEYSLAVNRNIVRENTKLKDQDTVALLPPFSGG